jgi:tRNA (guanine-N7-)-methyltransferase
MFGNSHHVHSNQDGIHPHLLKLLDRHRASPWQKPISDHTRTAFDAAIERWHEMGRPPIVLDAACGTGASTLLLASQWPGHFVIGIDQSQDRLARGPLRENALPANVLLQRADAVDFWRLAAAAGIRLARHYLLYPNPWPRKQQLQRRWHGHPAFTELLALGGELECRSNWKIYVDELATAWRFMTGRDPALEALPADAAQSPPQSPFERKYRASGHSLWRCRCSLP